MRKEIIFTFCLTLCLSFSGLSQETEQKAPGWGGDLSLGISLARGNSDMTNMSLSFTLNRKLAEKVDWENKGLYLLGKTSGNTDSESYELKSTMKWNHSERLFAYVEIHGYRDRFKNYDYRVVPQAGGGYKVLISEKTELSLTTGLTGAFLKFTDTGDTDYYTGISAGNHFSWKLSPSAEFSQDLNVNADLSRMSHYFAQLELSLSAVIVKGWAIKISLVDKYDNKPVGKGIKKNDILFITGLSMKF
jgi:putative salt-induced outer membrane protein YdiY